MALSGAITAAATVFILGLMVLPFVSSSDNDLQIESLNLNAGTNHSHSLTIGKIGRYDRYLSRQKVKVSGIRGRIVTRDVDYKYVPMYRSPDHVITCIRITDLKPDGYNGYARIVAGGIGTGSVTIRFKSQRSHGLRFYVDILGDIKHSRP